MRAHLLRDAAASTASSCAAGSNWEAYLAQLHAERRADVRGASSTALEADYARVHVRVRRAGGAASTRRADRARSPRSSPAPARRFASHIWRTAAAGNLGGWQVARCAVPPERPDRRASAREGGTSARTRWNKFIPQPFRRRRRTRTLERADLAAGVPARAQRDVVSCCRTSCRRAAASSTSTSRASTTRSGPTPTGSRGCEALTDEEQGRPARRADPDLERDGVRSPTTCCRWGTRPSATTPTPTRRTPASGSASASRSCASRASGSASDVHRHPRGQPRRGVGGERVLDRAVLADRPGRLARASGSTSSRRTGPGEKITVDEYYRWIFENSVPGLPEKAAAEGLTPLAVHAPLRRVRDRASELLPARARASADRAERRVDGAVGRRRATRAAQGRHDRRVAPPLDRREAGRGRGRLVDGVVRRGFPTPSRKLELYSATLADWGWPEHATARLHPQSHVHPAELDPRRARWC